MEPPDLAVALGSMDGQCRQANNAGALAALAYGQYTGQGWLGCMGFLDFSYSRYFYLEASLRGTPGQWLEGIGSRPAE